MIIDQSGFKIYSKFGYGPQWQSSSWLNLTSKFQLHCLTFKKIVKSMIHFQHFFVTDFFFWKKKEFMTWNLCQLKKQFSRFIRNLILAVWNVCNIYNEWFCNEFLCAKKSFNSAEKKTFFHCNLLHIKKILKRNTICQICHHLKNW